jgi:hypothetical protein
VKKHFEYLFIGSGIANLIAAVQLKRDGKSVLILEQDENYGGCHRIAGPTEQAFEPSLLFLPNTQTAQDILAYLEELVGVELTKTIDINPPTTFFKGELHKFDSYLNKPPAEHDEIAYYLTEEQILIKEGLTPVLEKLYEELADDMLNQSKVTAFAVEGDKVVRATVNGRREYTADNFVFGGMGAHLLNLFPQGSFEEKNLARLRRPKYWTSITLDIAHSSQITDRSCIHLLQGGKEGATASFGRFFPQNEKTQSGQTSKWITFVMGELTSDDETTGTALREIKKQLKRAYPESINDDDFERIVVHSNSHGKEKLKANADQTVAGFGNFWLNSGRFHKQKNLLGAVSQAQLVLSSWKSSELRKQRQTVHSNFGKPEPKEAAPL